MVYVVFYLLLLLFFSFLGGSIPLFCMAHRALLLLHELLNAATGSSLDCPQLADASLQSDISSMREIS
jgi:hypothetical protein